VILLVYLFLADNVLLLAELCSPHCDGVVAGAIHRKQWQWLAEQTRRDNMDSIDYAFLNETSFGNVGAIVKYASPDSDDKEELNARANAIKQFEQFLFWLRSGEIPPSTLDQNAAKNWEKRKKSV
jgi:hypothetical protein